jgi:hypothetical protein
MKKLITAMALAAALSIPGYASSATLGTTPSCNYYLEYAQKEGVIAPIKTLISKNCAVMYSKNWVVGEGKVDPACQTVWGTLGNKQLSGYFQGKNALVLAQAIVTYNCLQMYQAGWVEM